MGRETAKKEQEMRLMYGVKVEDIHRSKQQQWKAMYLTIAASAVVTSLAIAADEGGGLDLDRMLFWRISLGWFLWLAEVGITAFGLFVIGVQHREIARYRGQVDRIERTFCPAVTRIHRRNIYKKRHWLDWDLIVFTLAFAATILVAFVIASYALLFPESASYI